MRVIGLQELCELPNGAIFSTLTSGCEADGLYRRGTVCCTHEDNREYYGGVHSDFYYHDLLACPDQDAILAKPADITFCAICNGGRWGNFDPDELFVLYEPRDIANLVNMLTGKTTGE